MKRTSLIIFLAIAAMVNAKVPLQKAIRQALAINASMKNQQLEQETLRAGLEAAQKRKWFTIDFSGAYRFSSETIQLTAATFPFINMIKPEMPPNTILVSSPENTFDFKFSMVQPIYAGGALDNAIRLEEAKAEAEKYVTQMKSIEVAGKVKASFFSYQLLQKKIDSLQFMLGTLSLHLERIENLYREELVRKTDILETKSKIAEVQLNLLDLQQLLGMEKIQFQRLTALYPEEVDPDYREEDWNLEEALEYLQSQHPFIRSMDERILQTYIQKKIIAGAALPQVAGFAELHYGKPGMNFFKNRWTTYVQSGLLVSVPVFNWGKTRREKGLVDLAREKISNQKQDFSSESEKNVRQLFMQKQAIAAKMKLLEDLVSYTEEDIRIKEKLYEENQLDHITFLMAVTNLEKYRSQSSELQSQLEMVKAGIVAAIGKLPEGK